MRYTAIATEAPEGLGAATWEERPGEFGLWSGDRAMIDWILTGAALTVDNAGGSNALRCLRLAAEEVYGGHIILLENDKPVGSAEVPLVEASAN